MSRFLQAYRLCKADEFSSVFAFRKIVSGKYLQLYFKPNGLEYSRLGLMVSKKIHKRANQRNYMKRAIREYFRINHTSWNGVDLIVRVRGYFNHNEYQQFVAEFEYLAAKFNRKLDALQDGYLANSQLPNVN